MQLQQTPVINSVSEISAHWTISRGRPSSDFHARSTIPPPLFCLLSHPAPAIDLIDVERELVAALGYRLSGPTAHTLVDHFTRHFEKEEGAAVVIVRSLAHHLADMALLDYRCVALLPSAVAASAVLLARETVMGYSTGPCLVAGYEVEDLRECMEAIYDMHENVLVWPGCAQMMEAWELTTRLRYSLPPPYMQTGMH